MCVLSCNCHNSNKSNFISSLSAFLLTRVCAVRVLGCFVGVISAVKLSVTFPVLLLQTLTISTAEIMRPA